MLRIINVVTGAYVGDKKQGKVEIKLGKGSRVIGYDAGYERAKLFTMEEAYKYVRRNEGFAIIGIYPHQF